MLVLHLLKDKYENTNSAVSFVSPDKSQLPPISTIKKETVTGEKLPGAAASAVTAAAAAAASPKLSSPLKAPVSPTTFPKVLSVLVFLLSVNS